TGLRRAHTVRGSELAANDSFGGRSRSEPSEAQRLRRPVGFAPLSCEITVCVDLLFRQQYRRIACRGRAAGMRHDRMPAASTTRISPEVLRFGCRPDVAVTVDHG